MSTYRRFVTYLFQYEENQKKGNCGFAKVEVRQDKCRIELQVKGVAEKRLSVYLFARDKNIPVGVYLGDLLAVSGGGVFLLPADQIGETPYSIDDMCGLYITDTGETFMASQWDDEETEWSAFRAYKPDEQKEAAEASGNGPSDVPGGNGQESAVEVPLAEPGRDGDADEAEVYVKAAEDEITEEKASEDGGIGDKMNGERTAEDRTAADKMTGNETTGEQVSEASGRTELHTTQVAQAVRAGSSYPFAKTWGQQWQRFTAAHPVFHPFDADMEAWAVKMDLRDFKMMPKKFWCLANNSFLLHGYFNYRYVLFGYMGEENKKWFVGVPGFFQNQEQLLAGIFGFPEFRTKQECLQKTGEFGYWYRYLDL